MLVRCLYRVTSHSQQYGNSSFSPDIYSFEIKAYTNNSNALLDLHLCIGRAETSEGGV